MLIWGARTMTIEGRFCQDGPPCSYCGQSEYRTAGFIRYVHVYWIPMFPVARGVVAECNHCRRTVEASSLGVEFGRAMRKQLLRPTSTLTAFAGPAVVVAFVLVSGAAKLVARIAAG
jgi:hypothetical protein